jgi:hypothetical protein
MPAQTKPNNSQEPTSVIGQPRLRPLRAQPLSCAQLAPPRALLVCHVVLPPGLRLAARPANSRFGRSARPP